MPARSRGTGRRSSPPRGFALPGALFALLVVSALAAGAFFAALQELRAGRNGRAAEVAFDAAEAGLVRAQVDGRTGAWGSLAVGDSAVAGATLPGGTGRFTATVLRLNARLFLVRSAGSDAGGQAERAVAMLARRRELDANLRAALTAAGPVELRGDSHLDGNDTDPAGWSGCDGREGPDAVAGLAVPGSTDLLTGADCAGGSCLLGDPGLLIDPAISDTSALRLGGLDWDDLRRLARKVYPAASGGIQVIPGPVAGTGTDCDRSAADNWGEPQRPPSVAACLGYFPVILVRGDLTLAGGRGQGVLLVEGDLVLTGGAEFYGVVLVGGSVTAGGAGGRVLGGVVAGARTRGVGARLEGLSVVRSGCAVAAATAEIAPVEALRERSWALIY